MSAQADNGETVEGSHEPRECMACRGTGRVISNLGGSPSAIECPWCGGRALRINGHDAQAHWIAEREAAGEQGTSAETAAPSPDAA